MCKTLKSIIYTNIYYIFNNDTELSSCYLTKLRENESDRKLELTKRLGRRKKVFDEIEYKENVASKQNETAHFELVRNIEINIFSNIIILRQLCKK